jgi:hypothetical protein
VSRSDVRAAIAAFLASANIVGLQNVYQALPMFRSGELLNLGADNAAGAYAWIELGQSEETRISVPAKYPGYTGSGDKTVHYPVTVIVEYQYLIPQQLNSQLSPDDWVLAEDAILQGIKDRIHSDPTLGANGTIFAAAQEPNSLRIDPDSPVLEPGKVMSVHGIEFRVTEVIQA